MSGEEWRPIPGAEGYEASSLGRIRSWRLRGRRDGRLAAAPRILSPTMGKGGYLVAGLAGRTRPVHRWVMESFVGPLPSGYETRHLDGDRLNNALTNLRYGTRSENQSDAVRHGTHRQTRKTHCLRGHAFDDTNTGYGRRGNRRCRACDRERTRAVRALARAG